MSINFTKFPSLENTYRQKEIDKIIMIKKQAFKSVFYLVSNEKIVSNLSLEDWLVLLPGHKFIKSADDIIFQKAFI